VGLKIQKNIDEIQSRLSSLIRDRRAKKAARNMIKPDSFYDEASYSREIEFYDGQIENLNQMVKTNEGLLKKLKLFERINK